MCKNCINYMKNKFVQFWMELFFKPTLFYKKRLRNAHKEPAYFNFVLIVFGIGYGINRMDSQLIKIDMRGDLLKFGFLNNWFVYWLIVIFGGLIGGYFTYLIGGWFYDVRIRWSKGTRDLNKSRYMYLYSGVVFYIVVMIETIIAMFFYRHPYSTSEVNTVFDISSSIILLFFIFYSIYISFKGVRSITNAEKNRSILWFIVLPIIYYVIVFYVYFFLLLKNIMY